MRTRIVVASLLLMAVFQWAGCGGGNRGAETERSFASATDALGRRVSLAEKPSRIVSTAPSNTEIVLALGLRENLVGVTHFSTDPQKVEGIARVGGYTNPSVEKIVSLQPDIVFAARGNPRDVLEQLRRHGVKVFTLDTTSVSELLADIGKVGMLTGATERAKRLVMDIEKEIDGVRQKVGGLSDKEKPRVLWVGQENPLRTAGPGSLVDELIRIAGGENIAGDEKARWPSYSEEKVVLRDPQVIILGEDKYKTSPERVAETLTRFRRDEVWRNVSAVKAGRVHFIPTDVLGQPSPVTVEGLRLLAKSLHPHLFPDGNAEKTTAETERARD